jgi:hypothetical protein
MPAKIKAITPTLDQCGLNPRAHKKAVEIAVGVTAVFALKSFEGVVQRWKHKVRFRIKQSGDEAEISTDDAIFLYQDKGTKGPYMIRPRRKKALYWKGARHPVRVVRHPGLKAQGFSAAVQKATDQYFPDEMDRQIAREAAKKR